MNWKKISSRNGLLYVILDKKLIDAAGIDILALANRLVHLGVDMFQLRVKGTSDKDYLTLAKKLSRVIREQGKLFIVNDRVDIAYLSNASGLHLGEEDIPVDQARKILGKKAIIGKTIHSLKELKKFYLESRRQNHMPDYLSFGPVFKTKTKSGLTPLSIKERTALIKKGRKLIFAIGGINQYNIESLLASGVKNVAVCRGIIQTKNLKTAVNRLKRCLQKAS